MIRPSRSSSTIPFAIILSLVTLTHAIDHLPNNDVSWLYPSPSSPGTLVFSTLDIINVSWISTHAYAFLNLACQNNGAYTSPLQLPVPATGNRLVPLKPAAGYQGCQFEISALANATNTSRSARFSVGNKEDQPPVLWTIDHSSSDKNAQADSKGSRCKGSGPQKTLAMVGIGIGAAVGVFAFTTAVYTLVHLTGRKRQLRAAGNNGKKSIHRRSMSRTEDWVLERASSSDIREVEKADKKQGSRSEERSVKDPLHDTGCRGWVV
ncbi:MAG: hypothetical protein L6R39_001297 [Caloplaca ligustica]|nr:MAG: hypothetical protein L6R39_001297 [Caloplaca ligustica]